MIHTRLQGVFLAGGHGAPYTGSTLLTSRGCHVCQSAEAASPTDNLRSVGCHADAVSRLSNRAADANAHSDCRADYYAELDLIGAAIGNFHAGPDVHSQPDQHHYALRYPYLFPSRRCRRNARCWKPQL